MSETLVNIHSFIRVLILVAAVVSLFAIYQARSEGGWTTLVRTSTQIYAALLSIQVLIGVWLWIDQKRWTGGEVFLDWVHPIAMLVAVGVAHGFLGRARRELDDRKKDRLALIAVLGSLVIVVLAIPWFAS